MSNQDQSVPVTTSDTNGEVSGPDIEAKAPPNPLLMLHRLLKGRYPYAIALALIGGIAGGATGYNLVKPIYQSTGLIRYKPSLPRILYDSEKSSVMPMFDAFVESQSQLIRSQRVLDMAMQDDSWKSLGKSFQSTQARAGFYDTLEARKPRRATIILVSFTSPDPDIARNAVSTTIDAYKRIYGETDAANDLNRISKLEQRRVSLSNQLASIRSRILSIANEFGSDALEQIYDFKLQQLNELEQTLSQLGVTIAMTATSSTPNDTPPDGDDKEIVADSGKALILSVEEIAMRDPRMRQLLDERSVIMREVKVLRVRFGEFHRTVTDATSQLDLTNDTIKDYAKAYRESYLNFSETPVLTGTMDAATDMGDLQLRTRRLQSLYDRAKADLLDLGRKKLQIDNLKAETSAVQKRLEDTEFRIEQLNVESGFSGRIEVLSKGDQPLVPYKDKRIQFAVAAAGAGGFFCVAPLVLHGLVIRRLRSFDDMLNEASNAKLLGMLPNLPADMSDPEQWRMAGYCVHHIRTLLQLGPVKSNRRVFCITSPVSGTGKTSLTLALGLSFATSGSRTLLIDCDFAGGGLTHRLETIVRRRIGDILRRRGLVNNEQLEQALQMADTSGRRLGETLLDLGFLSEENLNQSLISQEQSQLGLIDALNGESIDQCSTNVGVDHLDILPIGGGRAPDVSRVSPAAVQRIIQESRSHYDIVLFDTGPIPGGVETSIVASQVDGVVMLVSRGDHQPQVKTALGKLQAIGAFIEGLVFNRADAREVAMSSVTSSTTQNMDFPQGDESVQNKLPSRLQQERIGPVAQAVNRTIRSRKENSD